jgi:transcription initiation factor IIF auxiliary subunit
MVGTPVPPVRANSGGRAIVRNAGSAMKPVQLSNTSRLIPDQPEREQYHYYDWKVFIKEDPDTLAKIDHVTYFLHPTFPDPVRAVSDPSTGFALETKGWGEFEIRAQIHSKGGTTQNTTYMLDLSKGA